MPFADPLVGRLDVLESRAMEQDRVIDDLNVTITAQWRVIDTLTRRLADLDERLRDLGRSGGAGPSEPPPPHY